MLKSFVFEIDYRLLNIVFSRLSWRHSNDVARGDAALLNATVRAVAVMVKVHCYATASEIWDSKS